jgi:ectoine hydroxylase-related dioxygenase (phytanoyl-CoA dioxygenase family)
LSTSPSIAEAVDDPADGLRQLNGKLRTEGMFRVFTEPALIDIVESVIGPEILAHPQFNVRAKLPNQDATVVPWHQDLGYLQADAEETFMVNFWIPLVDATLDNGCMEVICGSHRTPLFEHEQGLGPAGNFKGVRDQDLPPGERVLCPVREGGVLLIQHKTFHRSLPNNSDHIRWSLDLRYSDPDMPTGRDDVPGFITRSRRRPDSVCDTATQWNRMVAASGASAGS